MPHHAPVRQQMVGDLGSQSPAQLIGIASLGKLPLILRGLHGKAVLLTEHHCLSLPGTACHDRPQPGQILRRNEQIPMPQGIELAQRKHGIFGTHAGPLHHADGALPVLIDIGDPLGVCELGIGIGRVHTHGLKNLFPGIVQKTLAGHGFHHPAHQPQAEVGIAVLCPRLCSGITALQHLPQRRKHLFRHRFPVGFAVCQTRGMGEQVPQGDGRIGITGNHLTPSQSGQRGFGVNLPLAGKIQRQQGSHTLGDRCRPVDGILPGGDSRLHIGIAIALPVKDTLLIKHSQTHAHHLILPADLLHLGVQHFPGLAAALLLPGPALGFLLTQGFLLMGQQRLFRFRLHGSTVGNTAGGQTERGCQQQTKPPSQHVSPSPAIF